LDSLQIQQEHRQVIGTIVEVHGPVVIIDCTQLPPLRLALHTCFDHIVYLFEMRQHLDERHRRKHTKQTGGSVVLTQTLTDYEAFLTGHYDELSEQQCYMRGSMQDSL